MVSQEFLAASCTSATLFLGVGFSRIFIFGPPDFFADLIAGFFLLIFVGKVPRKILQENPRQNPPKFIQQNSPTHLCRGAGPMLRNAGPMFRNHATIALKNKSGDWPGRTSTNGPVIQRLEEKSMQSTQDQPLHLIRRSASHQASWPVYNQKCPQYFRES